MKRIILAAVLTATGGLAQAQELPTSYDASLFAGLTWTFTGTGGTPGVTLKALSTNEPDVAGFAAGVTYNFDGSFGCDAGLAYNTADMTATLTYDFCLRGPQFGIGKALKEPTVATPE